ncbi:hypothetical protein TNCV_4810341 [Trichonephila clavipes]|nr:hypothetical protein TNCV_4810341 [Trichonephila clavipes]
MGKAIIDNKIDIDSCKKFHRPDVCGLLLSCTICTVRSVECYYPGKSDSLHCLKERYVLNDNYFETQKINSKSTLSKKSRRVKREIDACAYPKNLKTADVSCKTTKSTV